MPRKKIVLGVALAAVLATVTACGSTSRGGSDSNGPGNASAASDGSAGTASTNFGTLASPCGKGDAKTATGQGVTANSISIGYGDDRGFAQQPGLNQEIGDAVKAMITWCNNQGGINGRTINGDFYDAAITNIAPAIKTACQKDFMLVGEGWASDELAEQSRIACTLPAVPAYAIGPDFANAPMMYQGVPLPDDYQPSSSLFQMAQLFPDTKSGFAIAANNLPATQVATAKISAAAKAAGFTVLDCGVTMNYTGEPNYTPFAQKFKDCGAKLVYLPTPGPVANGLLTAMNQIGQHPKYLMQANGYSSAFAQWNTAGYGNDVYVQSSIEPLENASAVPAVKQYVAAVKAVNGKTALLGEQAASSFLLWATAAKDCGDGLTRQCVIDKLAKVKEWTGGGLTATQNPAANLPTACGLLLKLDNTSWTQAYPKTAGKFECSSKYQVKLPQSIWFADLNSDRIATQFLTDTVIKPQS